MGLFLMYERILYFSIFGGACKVGRGEPILKGGGGLI